MDNIEQCIDINSKYCPCLLADTNNCIFCSQLKGEKTCDCNWQGICILYEKHWQYRDKAKCESARSEEETEFVVKAKYGDNTYLLEFTASTELAGALSKTGAFVFLKSPQDAQFFYFPVGIMQVVNNVIQVLIEVVGPKSKKILANDNRRIIVRGPYYNGVLGQPWIDNITSGKIILVAGGVGQAPALPLAQKLIANNNEVLALLAPGKVKEYIIAEQLVDLGVTVHMVSSLRKFGMPMLQEWFAMKPDLVVSAGPDEQHYGIIAAMNTAGVNIPMAATNNATMCCGEGICGSCIKKTNDNKIIRLCKMQTEFLKIIDD